MHLWSACHQVQRPKTSSSRAITMWVSGWAIAGVVATLRTEQPRRPQRTAMVGCPALRRPQLVPGAHAGQAKLAPQGCSHTLARAE
jgi:hypothetical protein